MEPTTNHENMIVTRRFDTPDDRLDFGERGHIAIVMLENGTMGMHGILEPGWTWEADEKPLLGNPDACPMMHVGYCLAGELAVRLPATGEERHVRAGDFFQIPIGHHAHVVGDQRCELIMFAADAPVVH